MADLWRKPVFRLLLTAALLAGATLVVNGGVYFADPGHRKQLLAVFGDYDALRGALLLWWGFAALLMAGLVVASRWPVAALVLVLAGGIGHQLDNRFTLQPIDLAVPIVLFVVAARARTRLEAVVAAAVAAAAVFAVNVHLLVSPASKASDLGKLPRTPGQAGAGTVAAALGNSLPVLLVLGLALALGENVRSRRLVVDTLRQRAEEAERAQQQHQALAVVRERARISRELHDIVGHGLSVIVAQAQGGAAALDRHPDRTAEALRTIVGTGREALSDTRRLLGVLDGNPAVRPAGVATLPELVDRLRGTGLRVRLRIDGEPRPLPADVDLSVHRIVQEALTNTLKHAGAGAAAEVSVRYTAAAVEIDVRDGGGGVPDPPVTAHGYGLRGIAERVDGLGGELDFGPADGGGFVVSARLPLGAAR
ncbi:sensor histidine kinase [Amycolatopsis sp. NPDC026612]|uniref:sensor histidine kinase n=1 Tax=Amycolatopsis sp. NPDC026612 TaxID=3155466 RepID=UPI0033E6FEF3